MDYASGNGSNNSQTPSGYIYTAYSGSSTPELFSAAGTVHQIQIYNNTAGGRLRIWKGTFSGTTFTFDSYTEVIDVGGLSTGWITLTSGIDFTPFAVTASTGLIFYTHSTNTEGLIPGRLSSGYAGYNTSDPPFSTDLVMSQSSSGSLDVYIQGESS